ncbi:hypothetical protein [Streptomyces sp. NPDC050548]|uniref:hypothetical protein n=1 Tax=Streptomyces sp. NPDC050548 TaxID=3365629 RepID=UPI0037BD774E
MLPKCPSAANSTPTGAPAAYRGAAAVGRWPDGTAFAVVTQREAEAKGLNGALAQARYARSSARGTAGHGSALVDASVLTGPGALLTGVPAEVRPYRLQPDRVR